MYYFPDIKACYLLPLNSATQLSPQIKSCQLLAKGTILCCLSILILCGVMIKDSPVASLGQLAHAPK